MTDFFLGHYSYWFIFLLLAIGLYGMIVKKNIVKKLIGMTILQVSVIMFYISIASKWIKTKVSPELPTVPVLDPVLGVENINNYINPLPHTLMLTAIVVGVATAGVAFALVISIFKRYKTLDESILLDRMKKDNDTE
jgi:multicomponent Na+:H+ antiporter subunit C